MKKEFDDGGLAFPTPIARDTESSVVDPGMMSACAGSKAAYGMSMLEYYAGRALQGELAAQCLEYWFWDDLPRLAARCFDAAEAMVAEHKRRKSQGE